jgi:hypothetical protein
MGWLRWLLDGTAFVTRDHCGDWTPLLAGLYVAGNALVALSYFTIPVTLIAWYFRRRENARMTRVPLRYQRVLAWFAAFILLCGLTHVCDCLAFLWPAYRAFTAVTFATGVVSAYVAARLPWVARENWNLVPAEALYAALDRARDARLDAELDRALAEANYREIKSQVEQLQEIAWRESAMERLQHLDAILTVCNNPEARR